MRLRRLSRRALLRGAGGVMLALPGLEAMLPRRAKAAGTHPKRFVVFFTPNGTNRPDNFIPAQTGPNFVLDMESAPLEPLRSKLLILSGISLQSGKTDDGGDRHSIGLSEMLTGVQYIKDPSFYGKVSNQFAGYAGGISIDQYLGKKLGMATKFPTLEFGVCTTTDFGVLPFSRMISAGPNMPVPPENDPLAMFKRIFSDGTMTSSTAVDVAHAQRRSILDFVQQDFGRLEQRLGMSDRQKLDLHLTAVRDLESRLARPPATVNMACGSGTFAQMGDPLDKANFPVTGKQHMDLLTLALKCDITRIASLQWSWSRSTLIHTWTGSTHGHHDMSHAGTSPELTGVNVWYAKQLLYLAQALAAADEGDGTNVLDHSVVYWCSDVNDGMTHSFDNMRAFFLGSCSGALKTGQVIALPPMQPHQKLLVTLLNAMGVMDNQFGDATYGTGPLSGVLA